MKRADTSAIRPEPFVTTIKLTITKIINKIIPIINSPPITKSPNVSITLPAAAEPLCPSDKISLVDATFKAKRYIVVTNNTNGNTLNSSDLLIKRTVNKITTDIVIFNAKKKSNIIGGSGTNKIIKIPIIPNARAISDCLNFANKLFINFCFYSFYISLFGFGINFSHWPFFISAL